MKEKSAQHDVLETSKPGLTSGRSPYVAPEIMFVEDLEVVADTCGKGAGWPGDCLQGGTS